MRNKKPLSDLKIKNAKIKDKNYQLGDTGGLYLNVKKTGSKLWEMRYTSPITKKRKLSSFGNYPVVSLSTARIKRDEYIELILKGIDPIENKKVKKQITLIDENGMYLNLIEEWLEKEAQDTKEITHKAKIRVFNNDVKPFLCKKHIEEVTVDDIQLIINKKKKKAPEIASRLFNYLDNLFRYAVLKRYCKRNILAEIRKADLIKPRTAKHMSKITDIDIVKELVNDIYNYNGGHSVKNVLKLVLHLPLRAENLCNLKWEQLDFEKKALTIPRENMKLSNINIDDFKLPLTDEVINILEEQKEIQTKYTSLKEYVFLGRDNRTSINKESPNRVLERLGYNNEKRGSKIRLHGFRGTFRSLIDTLDTKGQFSFEVKERALDHHDKNLVVRAYNHKANYSEQMNKLMNFWSSFICEKLNK